MGDNAGPPRPDAALKKSDFHFDLPPELIAQAPLAAIKVDVEGHEAAVMAELVNSRFLSRIQSVFYEVDAKWSDADDLRAILESGGFTNFTTVGRGNHYDVLATRQP